MTIHRAAQQKELLPICAMYLNRSSRSSGWRLEAFADSAVLHLP